MRKVSLSGHEHPGSNLIVGLHVAWESNNMFCFDLCLAQTGRTWMFIFSRGYRGWWLVDQQRVNVIEQGGGKLQAGLSLLWEEGTVFYFGKQHYPLIPITKLSN